MQLIFFNDECLDAFTDTQFRLNATKEVLAIDCVSPFRGLDASTDFHF